jgi:hypothetical protein
VADAVILAEWEGRAVGLGEVVDTMVELRRRSARVATRTSVMTLIVVAGTDDEEARAGAALHGLGDRHTARIVTIRTDPGGPNAIDARVLVWGSQSDPEPAPGPGAAPAPGVAPAPGAAPAAPARPAPAVFGDVRLTVHGGAAQHLDSIIEPFTLSDLPVVVWYPGALPDSSAALVESASAVLVDSKEAEHEGVAQRLVELAHACDTVVDLSWVRLAPWRELLAALFEGRDFRTLSATVRAARVEGKSGPRRLLAGWFISRLDLPPRAVELVDAVHAGLWLEADSDGRPAHISATRTGNEREVRASVTIEGGPSHSQLLTLPDDTLSWSLAHALTHLDPDPIWQEALAAAPGLGA